MQKCIPSSDTFSLRLQQMSSYAHIKEMHIVMNWQFTYCWSSKAPQMSSLATWQNPFWHLIPRQQLKLNWQTNHIVSYQTYKTNYIVSQITHNFSNFIFIHLIHTTKYTVTNKTHKPIYTVTDQLLLNASKHTKQSHNSQTQMPKMLPKIQ